MDWDRDGDDWGPYVAQHRADEDAEARHNLIHDEPEDSPECHWCQAALRDAAIDAEDDTEEEE